MDKLNQMRNYFNSGITKPYAFRKEQLKKLKDAVKKYENLLRMLDSTLLGIPS